MAICAALLTMLSSTMLPRRMTTEAPSSAAAVDATGLSSACAAAAEISCIRTTHATLMSP